MSKKTPSSDGAEAASNQISGTIETMPGEPGPGIQVGGFDLDPVSTTDPFAHVGDEHWGRGGRYIVVDGKRIPAPLTADTETVNG